METDQTNLVEVEVESAVEAVWTFRYPNNAELIPYDEIDTGDRSRKDFGNLEELANDIKKNGLIHPPLVTISSSGHTHPYTLVAGERRFRAMRLLEISCIPTNVRDHMPRHEVLELELMENFHRKQMLWQEQCVLIAKTHREKVRVSSLDSLRWGTRETGYLLGVSNAHVAHANVLAPMLLQGDAELAGASTMFAAYEIILSRRENEAASLTVQNLNAKASLAAASTGGIRVVKDDVDDIFGEVLDPTLRIVDGEAEVAEFLAIPTAGKLNLDLTSLFSIGDCLEVMPTMPEECVDHIITDPPYGIDLTQMAEMKNINTVTETHDVEQNISMFEPFLLNAFRIVKPNGYVVFWYDLDHHEKLQSIAKRVGFKVQRWPIIWHKLHPCKNASPRTNFTKNYECAMVLRKTIHSALVEPQTTSIFSADGQADRKLYDNPFSKPLAAWKFILGATSYQGQTIYDPYAGQMSCARACINMGRIPMGCEIDPDHYNKGIVQLTKLIKEING